MTHWVIERIEAEKKRTGERFPPIRISLNEAHELIRDKQIQPCWDYYLPIQRLLKGEWGCIFASPVKGPALEEHSEEGKDMLKLFKHDEPGSPYFDANYRP